MKVVPLLCQLTSEYEDVLLSQDFVIKRTFQNEEIEIEHAIDADEKLNEDYNNVLIKSLYF